MGPVGSSCQEALWLGSGAECCALPPQPDHRGLKDEWTGEKEDVLAVFQRDGKPWKEEAGEASRDPGAGEELTFVMNIHLRKRQKQI